MEIQSGTYLLEGVKGANCYFVTTEEGSYLIDTGMPGNAGKIIEQIRKLGQEPEEIRLILLTHSDMDHAGSAAGLKRLTKAQIAIHEDDAPALAGERELKKVKGLIGVIFRLILKGIKFETLQPDMLLKDGEMAGPFKVIHVPGHTEGSACFYYAQESILFAGDALRTDKNGNPCFSPQVMNLNTVQAKESVKKLNGVNFLMLLPGHGRPILESASDKVADCLMNLS
jgi:Zn-dependent hydrolases, including glyoxylases